MAVRERSGRGGARVHRRVEISGRRGGAIAHRGGEERGCNKQGGGGSCVFIAF